ncbi:MAG: hypothetical protein ACOY93_10175 [Bacillota bacterium]
MQHPMREQIKLESPWQATLNGTDSASLFIPGSWSGRRLVLKPAPGVSWSSVRTEAGEAVKAADGWQLTDLVEPGSWQTVWVEGGSIAGALVEASEPLHITRLEAWYDPPETLSMRVRLAKSPSATGRKGLITLLFTLTDERGEQVGRQEVVVGAKTAELAVAMMLPRKPHGRCRLKAALCLDQQVIDDARIELEGFE